jgi:hypothetical protein
MHNVSLLIQEDGDADFGPYPVALAEGSDHGPPVVVGFCMVMGYQARVQPPIFVCM